MIIKEPSQCVILGLHREVYGIFILLSYCAVYIGNSYGRFGITHLSILQRLRNNHIILYKRCTKTFGVLWFLDLWRWDRYIVLKRQWGMATICRVIIHKSADLRLYVYIFVLCECNLKFEHVLCRTVHTCRGHRTVTVYLIVCPWFRKVTFS